MFAKRLFRTFTPRPLPRYSSPLISRCTMASHQQSSQATMHSPRDFPSTGFDVINQSQKVEEEQLPYYNPDHYYPMRIGEVLRDRYQIVTKLGYGTSSTVWLCRDLSLREQSYWALKVHTNCLKHNQELEIYRHLAGVTMEHSGREYIRQLEESFKLKGCNGSEHDVLVMKPLGLSLRAFQAMQTSGTFLPILVVSALDQVLTGLDYLHEADVIHTDLHSDNLLIAITDDSILSRVEENEIRKPSTRKQVGDNIIYVSRYMLGGAGPLTICDFGQARIGSVHSGKAMPVPCRAPEVILNMEWGNAVDIWSVGLLAWDLLEREFLFRVYDHESEEQNDAHHLAMMTALLGPPPPEFLNRSKETKKYWNEDGKWNGPVPLPIGKTFDSLANALAGDERDQFIDFVQCLLCWLPEDRLTAEQASYHPWLSETS